MTSGNFELQREYLSRRQQAMSTKLFELGVVSRLIDTGNLTGAAVPVQGLDQLDKLFVPGLKHKHSDGKVVRILSLVAIGQDSQSFGYFELGELDETALVFPFPGIDAQDAEAVRQAAQELLTAKKEGTLSDLSSNLLSIENPNNIMIIPIQPNDL